MSTLLVFENVSKSFIVRNKHVEAIKNISLSISEGEVFGFVGPNGAGKSTTIKVMLNIISDYVGNVRLFGASARLDSSRRGVAFVPESPAHYDQLSPIEILRASLQLNGIKRLNEDAWCMQWLERFSIAHTSQRKVRELSKGTVQRLALAHAMVTSPRLLVLDEPLSGLDPIGRKDVVDILDDYRKQGGTIFLTSHVLHDVERLADRFGLIYKGELKTIKSPNDLVDDGDMVTIRSLGTTPVFGMSSENGGRWFAEIRRSEVWAMLNIIEQSGHALIEIKPTLSLESAFFRYLSASDDPAPPSGM